MKRGASSDIQPTAANQTTQKRVRTAKGKDTGGQSQNNLKPSWPDHFHYLFKVFKALNTVLAFLSSKKHVAATFDVVRSSVEGLLKHPLDLSNVAELKALLPELIKFMYIPQNELRINDESRGSRSARESSPNFAIPSVGLSGEDDGNEEVLILDFADNIGSSRSRNSGFHYTAPTKFTAAATTKLIAKRNERFQQAVKELLQATPDSDDPVILIQKAGKEHVPKKLLAVSLPQTANNTVPRIHERPSVEEVISEIQNQSWYNGQIVYNHVTEAKEAKTIQMTTPVSQSILKALESHSITSFYTHQVAAMKALEAGKHVIVSTNTSSGKSIIYQVPVLKCLEESLDNTAMFIYPTKALAQDQRAALESLLSVCPEISHLKVANYDGDTPQAQRRVIRDSCSVVFTNFDTIHASILPHEEPWRTFLRNLKLVVIDELHYYSGLFGSHAAQIIRRLRRLCAALGNRCLQFVSCSATISNPGMHMQRITGLTPQELVVVSEDGAPNGHKNFLVWNPPFIDPMEPALGRKSSISEAVMLMSLLMKHGIRVILFCKSRPGESAMKTLIGQLGNEGRYDILERVKSYRGGYSQEDRRRIEHDAFTGLLLGIVATNALELGVDIGVLDGVIMLGFPAQISSLRQQAGRAGRRAQDSLAVFIADPYPVDQYYVNNPEDLFNKLPSDLLIDLDNELILEPHLQCAGQELPLSWEDEKYFGPLMKQICKTRLRMDDDGWYHTHPNLLPYPAQRVSIRGIQEEKYAVVLIRKSGELDKIIEEVEVSRAMFELYEGGVFMHQGMTFVVNQVNHETQIAKIMKANVNYFTSPRDFTDIDPLRTHRIKEWKCFRAYYGKINVYVKVFGFYKLRNNQILDTVDIEMLPWERETTGFWIDVPKSILALMRTKQINPAEAIHSAQHAFLNQFLLAEDVKTECKAPEKEYKVTESNRKRPARLIFYDTLGKGGGVAVKAYENVQEILRKALKIIETCDCDTGCAKCIQSTTCREANQVCSKLGARVTISGILGVAIDPNSIPIQIVETKIHDTVVDAEVVGVVEGVKVERSEF